MSKYIKLIISLLIIGLITFLGVSYFNKKENEKDLNVNNMISYTLDGEIFTEKLKKGKGYIANKVICEGGTNIVFDNTNWEVEIINANKEDRCVIDFTKNKNTEGYRVSSVGNVDSSSKATINGGIVRFYPKEGYLITGVSGCNGTIKDNYVEVTNVTSNQTCNISTKITFKYKILADNPNKLEREDFNTTLGSETPTNNIIYKASGAYTEDGSEVYYFAGNVSNNWVKFGKDENDKDLYWRIIRTNEDGSVRLLYAGTSPDTIGAYIIMNSGRYFHFADEAYNTMYVGYMYGTEGSLANNRLYTNSSNAKKTIDIWYSRGLNVKTDTSGNTYDKYVSRTAIYCNDRSGDGYKSSGDMYYAAYNRLESSKSPSYRCGMKPDKSGLYSDANVADKFSASTTKGGNGQLQYPVALMTADELAMAGGKYGERNQYVYYRLNSTNGSATGNNSWWTMTPTGKLTYSSLFTLSDPSKTPGHLYQNQTNGLMYLRPVLSLKSCVTYKSGNGTSSTPYEVSVDSICTSAEN